MLTQVSDDAVKYGAGDLSATREVKSGPKWRYPERFCTSLCRCE